jgi:hypothetical protein
MDQIRIAFGPDRGRCGLLTLLDDQDHVVCGPFPVAGRSGDRLAAQHGNPARNPLLRYGDTPEGTYRVTGFVGTGTETSYDPDDRGPHGVIVIEAVAGDAALAEANGRYRLLIEGGAAGVGGTLRSTAGSLRLYDHDQATLLAALDGATGIICECIQDPTLKNMPLVTIDDNVVECDPPRAYADTAERTLAGRGATSRRALLVGTVVTGAMALSLAVSFVALDAALPADVVAQTY